MDIGLKADDFYGIKDVNLVLISLRKISEDFEKTSKPALCIRDSLQIRELFSAHGLSLQDWDKIHTHCNTFRN